ncbi:MAG TPA: beta-L-arabinofuranosidase domain-containing protein, partial [Puia sp.]
MRIKSSFSISFIFLLLSSHGLFAKNTYPVIKPVVIDAINDVYVPSPYENQRIGGIIGLRMDINLNKRLLQIDQETMLSGFLSRPGKQDWIGEHVGKYLETACNTWQYSHNPELKKQMDNILFALLGAQLANGYLGTYTPDKYWTSWDVWVHKYDLIGLLAYYKTFGYQPALDAAKKIGNLMIKTFGNNPGQLDLIPAGEHVGMASTSILDPMIELYRYTGELKYLDFTRYILRAYNQQNGPKIIQDLLLMGEVNKVADGKAYEMLSNLVGIIKLYKVTGEKNLYQAVIIAWNDIVNNRLYITGTASSFENFQGKDDLPGGSRDNIGEGCVTTTWIQLNYQLFTLTGEVKYMDQLE